jgi:hypothetical protein
MGFTQDIGPQAPYDPVRDIVRNIKFMLWSAGLVAFLSMLVLNLAIVLALTPEIQTWIASPEMPRAYIFVIVPWPVLLFWLDGAAFQAWHIALLGILLAAFARAAYDLKGSWLSGKGKAIASLMAPERAGSSLEAVAKLFMACMFFSTAYFLLINALGADMDTPAFGEMSRPELIFGLFSASVFEELISRVLLVGVPLALIALFAGRERPLSGLLGGGMGLTRATAALLLFSSLMFAFAHVGSWDLWKVPQVLVTGLALGWAFVRYGLHASILIHFSINLSTSALEIWPGSMAAEALLSMAFIIWLVAGGYFFFHYAIALARHSGAPVPATGQRRRSAPVRRARRKMRASMRSARRALGIRRRCRRISPVERLPPPPPGWQMLHGTVPPPPGAQGRAQPQQWPSAQPLGRPAPPGTFVCAACGGTDAAYEAGALRCLRCGAVRSNEGRPASRNDGKVEF